MDVLLSGKGRWTGSRGRGKGIRRRGKKDREGRVRRGDCLLFIKLLATGLE